MDFYGFGVCFVDRTGLGELGRCLDADTVLVHVCICSSNYTHCLMRPVSLSTVAGPQGFGCWYLSRWTVCRRDGVPWRWLSPWSLWSWYCLSWTLWSVSFESQSKMKTDGIFVYIFAGVLNTKEYLFRETGFARCSMLVHRMPQHYHSVHFPHSSGFHPRQSLVWWLCSCM